MATEVSDFPKDVGGAVRESSETASPYIRIGTASGDTNLRLLESALREKMRGEVLFDSGSRALYATDGSNYRQVPLGVAIPRDEDDVIHAVRICGEFGAPVLNRGGATSLAGQCCKRDCGVPRPMPPPRRAARLPRIIALGELGIAIGTAVVMLRRRR